MGVVAHMLVAEVLDKITLPWEPSSLAEVAVVGALCVALALPSRPFVVRIVAAAIACAWGMARITLDPWWDAFVGRALRTELGDARSILYMATLLASSALPLALAAFAAKRRAPATAW